MEENPKENRSPLTASCQRMSYELEIQQVELEMQQSEIDASHRLLEESENRYRNLYQFAPVAYITLNQDGILLQKNKLAGELLQDNHTRQKPFIVHIVEEDHPLFFAHLQRVFMDDKLQVCHVRLKHPLAKTASLYVKLSSILLNDHSSECLTAIIDVDELKRQETEIRQKAYYDTLTNIPNRHMFMEQLTQALQDNQYANARIAVFFIDLDNFKQVNDTQGHAAGDMLLQQVSRRIQTLQPPAGISARLAGDEFTLLLPSVDDHQTLIDLAVKLLEAINSPYHIQGQSHTVSASIGIAIAPENGKTADELLTNADTAMYKAKSCGKGTYSFFDDTRKEAMVRKVIIERLLPEAYRKNELYLYYQPQISTTDGSIRGFETLLRWHNAELGTVAPLDFIPIAEENHFIIPLGEWVLLHACQQNQALRQKGFTELVISINTSSVQWQEPTFADAVAAILAQTGLTPQGLGLEIKEALLVEPTPIVRKNLQQLKMLGVQIHLDNFGIHYTSLSQLKTLSVDAIKLDQSLVQQISHNPKKQRMVRAIIALAHELQIQVVAEGVEDSEQVQTLGKFGCDALQGYYFARPAAAASMEKLLFSHI